MATKKPEDDPDRRPYQRPSLRKVDLRPEEAVLGSCKVATSGGPGGSDCLSGTDCFVQGS